MNRTHRLSQASLLTLALLCAAPALAPPALAGPDVVPAAERLRDAFGNGTSEEVRVDALAEVSGAAAAAADAEIVDLVAAALRDRSVSVRRAAIDALGAIDRPDALLQLHALYRRDERLRRDEETFVRLLRAIGRKGDASSVAVLTDDIFDRATIRTAAARVHGLGRIRTDASLEALFRLAMNEGAGSRRREATDGGGGTAIDRDFRLSIAALTGVELEPDRTAWQRWWTDNRKTFHVAPDRPDLPASLVALWEEYWGERWYADRPAPPPARTGPPGVLRANPSAAQVAEAVAALEAAFGPEGDAPARVLAITTYAGVLHEDVVVAAAKGLDDSDDAVRLATIDVFGWVLRGDALKQLHRLYRRDQALRADEVLFSRLLQAIGRHGDASSLDVLEDHPFDRLTLASGKARILGIARIRDARSVDLLIEGLRLAGGDPRGSRSGAPRFMDDFSLGLAVLTGEDLGPSKDAWESWAREHRRFAPAPARPPLSAPLRAAWAEYWNENY